MSDPRYGLYLRPSYEMSKAQTEVYGVLKRQYGLKAAGNFMPHATLKGFFRSSADEEEMMSRLDTALEGREAFKVFNGGVTAFDRYAIVIDINYTREGAPNAPLQDLHRNVMDTLVPFTDSGCNFTREEMGWAYEKFRAHLTLAMADIPDKFFKEVLEFTHQAEPIGPTSFLAETLQFFVFYSEDWRGPWWETLRWELLNSWRLTAPGQTWS